MYRCLDGWMDVSVGCNISMYVYVSIGNTTDIKLADRFSRAVDFFFDKVTQLAGWQVVFFFYQNWKDKNKYVRRCAYYA